MSVVLGDSDGERVLLYGTDGSVLRALVADSSGNLVVVGPGASGALVVIQDTPDDLRSAIYGIEGANQRQVSVDTSGQIIVRSIKAGGAFEAWQDTPADLKIAVFGLDGATQREIAVQAGGRLVVSAPRERSGKGINAGYLADLIGPHGGTERWSYTVPAGKNAIIESVDLLVRRDAAAGPAAIQTTVVFVQPTGGSDQAIVTFISLLAAVPNVSHERLEAPLYLYAADKIRCITDDASTGGSHAFRQGMIGVEFDE